jgi:hypothetical protein
MRRLEPDEPTVRTSKRERFRIPVDGIAAADMFERNPFVPAMPLLAATKRTGHPRATASQEIEDLHESILPSRGYPYSPPLLEHGSVLAYCRPSAHRARAGGRSHGTLGLLRGGHDSPISPED